MIFKALIFTLFSSVFAHAMPYTMADLEALEGTKNFEEFFSHAKDVRPSLRSAVWRKMVLSMADLYIKELSGQLSISEKEFDRIWEISTWSPLRGDEFYAKKRNALAIQYLKQCLKSGEASKTDFCHGKIQGFFHAFDKERELGVEIAKTLGENGKSGQELWPFMAPMAKSAYGEFYCAKEPLYPVIIAKINANEDPKSFAHQDCVQAVGKRAQLELASRGPQVYGVLEKLGLIKPSERSKHLVAQLLSGLRYNEEKWDSAYQALKEMGSNLSTRKSLLETLSKMDRLPDGLFTDADKKRAMVVTKQLAVNFPEYLDFYTDQCLKWLAGEQDFAKGNPTPNCHEYFKMAKIIESSPAPVTKRYDQIMNSWKN